MDEMNMYDVTAQIAPSLAVDEIENDHMYVLGVAQDRSGTMGPYDSDMNGAMQNFVESVQGSKSDDEMLVSVTTFNSTVSSTGFQNVADLDTTYWSGGCTALYDAIIVAAKQVIDYVDQLNASGVRTRGGLVIYSDGKDNVSQNDAAAAAKMIAELIRREIMVAFVAFWQDAHGIAKSLGVEPHNVLETDATPSELRRVWGIISKSAVSASKSAAAGSSQVGFFDVT